MKYYLLKKKKKIRYVKANLHYYFVRQLIIIVPATIVRITLDENQNVNLAQNIAKQSGVRITSQARGTRDNFVRVSKYFVVAVRSLIFICGNINVSHSRDCFLLVYASMNLSRFLAFDLLYAHSRRDFVRRESWKFYGNHSCFTHAYLNRSCYDFLSSISRTYIHVAVRDFYMSFAARKYVGRAGTFCIFLQFIKSHFLLQL